jgi:aminotransferase
MMTVCNPGDKVAIFSPFYENYMADTILCGAEPIFIPLVPPSYEFDITLLEKAFEEGAKALVVCNPSNPCGKVFSRSELEAIAALAIRYDAFVITDEVYEHIIYEPYTHIAMASLPGMRERTITCNSFSKTYSITGWRLGYLIAPAEIADACRKVHDFLTVGAPAPLQEAVVTALGFPESYYKDLQHTYAEKRQYFLNGLDALGIAHNIPQATYYVMVDISAWLSLPQFQGWSDLQFCEWMTETIGVAAVPGSSFFREPVNHLIRLHFAREQETLTEALHRLRKMANMLPKGDVK